MSFIFGLKKNSSKQEKDDGNTNGGCCSDMKSKVSKADSYHCCTAPSVSYVFKATKQTFIKYNLAIILATLLIIALAYPVPGAYLYKHTLGGGVCLSIHSLCIYNSVSHICTCIVLFLCGLTLNSQQIKKAIFPIKPFALGMFLITFFTPIMAFAIATSPLLKNPPELSIGLSVFFAVPSTLNIGIAITKAANGNVALASLLTITSNILGLFLVPIYVTWLVPICLKGQDVHSLHVSLDPGDLIVKLVFTMIIPLLIGKAIRDFIPGVLNFTTRHKITLSMLSSLSISLVPWMQASAATNVFNKISAESMISIIFVFFGVHSYHMLQNYVISRKIFKIPESENKAVVVMSIQKSLPVTLSILATLPPNVVPNLAVAMIPPIISQLGQTFMDSIMAVRWADHSAARDRRLKERERINHVVNSNNNSTTNNNNQNNTKAGDEKEEKIGKQYQQEVIKDDNQHSDTLSTQIPSIEKDECTRHHINIIYENNKNNMNEEEDDKHRVEHESTSNHPIQPAHRHHQPYPTALDIV